MLEQDSSNPEEGLRPWQGALAGVAAGIIYGLFGFFLLRKYESPHMGETLFIILPLAVGATIAFVTPRPVEAVALLSATIALLICLISLISLHAEGILCAVLAFPLIFLSVVLGVGVGLLLRLLIRPFQNFTTNCLIFLVAPALVFAGHRLEMKSFAGTRTQSVTTTLYLPATPQQVWENIQSLDKLAARKSMLMYLGLPVPQRCVLQGTAVGSKRICYFDQGFIEESILEWDPPRHMRLSINRSNMPGRHWLDFEGAQYDLQADASGTVITRVTTIRSNLNPAWYWARFERWGVESEHDYLFRDLAGRFPVRKQP
jgi:hypothetical protein